MGRKSREKKEREAFDKTKRCKGCGDRYCEGIGNFKFVTLSGEYENRRYCNKCANSLMDEEGTFYFQNHTMYGEGDHEVFISKDESKIEEYIKDKYCKENDIICRDKDDIIVIVEPDKKSFSTIGFSNTNYKYPEYGEEFKRVCGKTVEESIKEEEEKYKDQFKPVDESIVETDYQVIDLKR